MNKRMLRQAQQLQKRMMKLQEELEQATVEATAGGGVVTVVVNGQLRLQSVKIEPEAVDPEDVEVLEDLVLTAVNDAIAKAQEMAASRMAQLTGGFNIPGLT